MDGYKLTEDIETIKKNLEDNIGENIDKLARFHIDELVELPNQLGCFKREDKWYIYETDEKNFCTYCGPFSLKGIVYACAMKLHVSKQLKEFRFSEEEFNVYLHNHFHSLKAIDEQEK